MASALRKRNLLACNHTILCVGGGISIDRKYRMNEWKKYCIKYRIEGIQDDILSKNFYWAGETPVYNDEMLGLIGSQFSIDTVITHTAPHFCELISKSGLQSFAALDESLLNDVEEERATMTKLYNRLVNDSHPLKRWYYGHFHQTWSSSINGVLFKMLDIIEFAAIYN